MLLEIQRWDVWDAALSSWTAEKDVKVQRVAQAVLVGGVTGVYAGFANGKYVVAGETHCGRPVYRKEVGGDVWIEYRADVETWIVLPSISRGRYGSATEGWIKSAGRCPGAMVAEDVQEWEVHDPGVGWQPQDSVVVVAAGVPVQACCLLVREADAGADR